MAALTVLRDDVLEQLAAIGTADLVVGIPSYNNARTISHVVRAIKAGIAKYFPDQIVVLVNSDGGSTDGTPGVVASTDLGPAGTILVTAPARPVRKVITAYRGVPGKGSALRTIFEIATRLRARACAVVDSDLRSINPEWIQLLLEPVLRYGFDYVCPLYSRHKYDGTITNAIVYPMVRALYGRRIRQPIGGDFGFSGRLAAHYLMFDVWDSDVARYGIDIWMTTTALVGDFRICQAYLGAKIHDAKDPGADLTSMLVQVTGSLFRQIEDHASFWLGVTGSEEVPEFGFSYEVGLEPVAVNLRRMVDAFNAGMRELAGLYTRFLSVETWEGLERMAGESAEAFHMPDDLWVRIVYEFAAAYHHRILLPEHLLKSLTPLYLGRTASWVRQAESYGAAEVEFQLNALCQRFEELKPYFLQLWQGGRIAA
jgi:glycosyltransferase involved in cell wall biosynthesis